MHDLVACHGLDGRHFVTSVAQDRANEAALEYLVEAGYPSPSMGVWAIVLTTSAYLEQATSADEEYGHREAVRTEQPTHVITDILYLG